MYVRAKWDFQMWGGDFAWKILFWKQTNKEQNWKAWRIISWMCVVVHTSINKRFLWFWILFTNVCDADDGTLCYLSSLLLYCSMENKFSFMQLWYGIWIPTEHRIRLSAWPVATPTVQNLIVFFNFDINMYSICIYFYNGYVCNWYVSTIYIIFL